MKPPTPQWSSRFVFILAVAGSAVGLGNIWKFPYIVGEHGGGAFMLLYLGCVFAIGVPILVAELSLGRIGGPDPAAAFAAATGAGRASWRWAGSFVTLTAFVVLSFQSVVAGWALDYTWLGLSGRLASPGRDAVEQFAGMLADPARVLFSHTAFMALTAGIVAAGVSRGLDRAVRLLMPALFAILGALVLYAAATSAHFAAAATYLFAPDWSRLTADALLDALGHACFTLSVGVGGMICYGAYAGRWMPLGRIALTVALLDTAVAVVAALAVFPFVFDAGLPVSTGPGLIFVSLPTAFAGLSGGGLLATVFFAFVGIAALTSSIALLEPVVNGLERAAGLERGPAVLIAAAGAWALGAAAGLTLHGGDGVTPGGGTLLEALDALTGRFMLPAGGLAVALAAGWAIDQRLAARAAGLQDSPWLRWWRLALRFAAPAAVTAVAARAVL